MYPSTFAHLNPGYDLPVGDSVAPARRKARRASATLPLWRSRPSLIRVLSS